MWFFWDLPYFCFDLILCLGKFSMVGHKVCLILLDGFCPTNKDEWWTAYILGLFQQHSPGKSHSAVCGHGPYPHPGLLYPVATLGVHGVGHWAGRALALWLWSFSAAPLGEYHSSWVRVQGCAGSPGLLPCSDTTEQWLGRPSLSLQSGCICPVPFQGEVGYHEALWGYRLLQWAARSQVNLPVSRVESHSVDHRKVMIRSSANISTLNFS